MSRRKDCNIDKDNDIKRYLKCKFDNYKLRHGHTNSKNKNSNGIHHENGLNGTRYENGLNGTRYESFKREFEPFHIIVARNLLVSVMTLVLLIAMIPALINIFVSELWIYTMSNIDIEYGQMFIDSDITDPLLKEAYDLWNSLITDPAISAAAAYTIVYTLRLVRFIYIILLSLMIIYLLIFFVANIIMSKFGDAEHKLSFKTVFFSCLVSALITLSFVFFIMPDEFQIFKAFLETIRLILWSVFTSSDLMDIAAIITDSFMPFYWSFVILFIVNLIIVSIAQYMLRGW